VTHIIFGSQPEDEHLETVNQEFWRALLAHVRADAPITEVQCILDIGCHRGGLLELLARHFQPARLLGLEPLAGARAQARFRLKGKAPEVQIMDVSRWSAVPTAGVDLATVHEVLHLVRDLEELMGSLSRVVRPGGWAFLVFGCHTENPLWQRWKLQLSALGHKVFDHSPIEILSVASAAGFHTSVRPLRRDGWVIYDPLTADFRYSSIAEMLDHQYRHKLLFRLLRRSV
jgi:SAM-dependent methyltransferase